MTRRGGRLVKLGAPPSADKAAALGVHAMFFVKARPRRTRRVRRC
jgi:hypothetical protein